MRYNDALFNDLLTLALTLVNIALAYVRDLRYLVGIVDVFQ